MSLENNLKRIADALEMIAGHLSEKFAAMYEAKDLGMTAGQPEFAPPVAPVAPAAPPAPPAAPVTYTPEEVNGILLKEAQRLKGPTAIHAEMKRLGVTGVQSATAEQITALITAVQAIEA